MDFTREPIVQTVITPKEGCKIVVRSSKNSGQEEYFVDAVEVVSFGAAIFFRSVERPKSFLVPASDYEVLEVREARMVLKNVGVDRTIKIGGGREAPVKAPKEQPVPKIEALVEEEESKENEKTDVKPLEPRLDKKRDRRRNSRRRRGRDDSGAKEGDEENEVVEDGEKDEVAPVRHQNSEQEPVPMTSVLTSLLPPPSTLISETIARYRDNSSFKNAFFTKDSDAENDVQEVSNVAESVGAVDLEYEIEQLPADASSFLSQDANEEASLDEKEETSALFVPLQADHTHAPSLLGEEFSAEKLTSKNDEPEVITTEMISEERVEATEEVNAEEDESKDPI